MRLNPSNSFLAALLAAVVLTGCGSTGVGDVLGGGRGSDNSTYNRAGSVQGTVASVNTRDRYVVVDVEDSRYDLRNGNENQQVTLYFDDRTDVEYQGKNYQPDDLERGDRIRAEVDDSGSRMVAQQIEVLYDATNGSSTDTLGGYGSRDDSRDDSRNNDYRNASDVRGTVRYVDTRDRTVEIETSGSDSRYSTGRSNLVVVHYNSQTVVEFQGQRYTPENLERGDEVEVDVRDSAGQLLAEQIVVVRDAQSGR
ncbi:MAG TPA: hypothetical protein VHC97_06020 [Thermoanaerobaculia bacterium]|jgi:hypothetical protein|nr:hypothetical protein [Thermoanaerobaculia bacterium]